MFDLTFTIDDQGRADAADAWRSISAVIAGWTGRDPVARDKHVAELEAIGIARPASTPIYYRVSPPAALTTAKTASKSAAGESSGEVEFVLIGWQGRIFVGVRLRSHRPQGGEPTASRSPSRCATSRSPAELWELEDVIDHWDQMILRSWAWIIDGERVLYQEGTLDAHATGQGPDRSAAFAGKGLPDGCAMFGGTFGGQGRHPSQPAGSSIELDDPVLKRKISHGYDVDSVAGFGMRNFPEIGWWT